MAKILYGVMGDARGHVNRARIIAREMPHHQFLFVGGDKVHDLEADGYPVEDVPMGSTYYSDNRVDIRATFANAVRVFVRSNPVIERVARVIERFDPDLILTDYEFFTPLAARRLGRFCVSLDHQHVITRCRYDAPKGQRLSRLLTATIIEKLYSNAHHFVIVSFFQLPPEDPGSSEVFPAIIRREITSVTPSMGDHVLVYQTSPTFRRIFPVLEELESRFLIYGMGELPERKNLRFMKISREGFLRDLASCRYVIANGGHNVLSEALVLGKPVFSFPIANAYEQFINAYFLARFGFGDYSTEPVPSADRLREFEQRLEAYRERIAENDFFGNDLVCKRLEEFIGSHSGSQSQE